MSLSPQHNRVGLLRNRFAVIFPLRSKTGRAPTPAAFRHPSEYNPLQTTPSQMVDVMDGTCGHRAAEALRS